MFPYLLDSVPDNDLFTNLPTEITIDILSTLPVATLMDCKCVSKSWRDLIECSDFVTAHHSKSTSSSSSSGLALIQHADSSSSNPYRICDDVGVDGCTTISDFGLPTYPPTTELCSANGLLLLFDACRISDHNLFVCNPVTREYIELPVPPVHEPCKATFGFGASKVTGEYKVVIICQKYGAEPPQGMVYSLRTGLWRPITTPVHTHDRVAPSAAFLNGNLHWLGCEFEPSHDPKLMISCFDLETEEFTLFRLPPRDDGGRCWSPFGGRYYLSALEGRLCFSDNVGHEKVVIWFVNKYGDENSWTKEFVISLPLLDNQPNCRKFCPVKVFRDSGDILFEAECCKELFLYSGKTGRIEEYAGNVKVRESCSSSVINYNPSFLSLKARGFQNVASFPHS